MASGLTEVLNSGSQIIERKVKEQIVAFVNSNMSHDMVSLLVSSIIELKRKISDQGSSSNDIESNNILVDDNIEDIRDNLFQRLKEKDYLLEVVNKIREFFNLPLSFALSEMAAADMLLFDNIGLQNNSLTQSQPLVLNGNHVRLKINHDIGVSDIENEITNNYARRVTMTVSIQNENSTQELFNLGSLVYRLDNDGSDRYKITNKFRSASSKE